MIVSPNLDEKCKKIKEIIEKNIHITFSGIQEETKFNDVTLSSHLRHLITENLVVNINRKYQLNPHQITFRPPFSISNIKFEIEIIKEDEKYNHVHLSLIRNITNDADSPLTRIPYHLYFSAIPIKSTRDMDFKCHLIKGGKQIELYGESNQPTNILENYSSTKKFTIDFLSYPLYKNEEMTLSVEYNTIIEKNTRLMWDPIVPAKTMQFVFSFPKKFRYNLIIYEINKYTFEETLTSIKPISHTTKTHHQLKCSIPHAPFPNAYLQFRWTKLA